MELFDTHSHLEMPRLYPTVSEIVKRARKAGVIGVVVSAIEPKFYSKALNLMNRFPGYVWATLGLHPPRTTPKMVRQCLQLIRKHSDQILAIGEVGLDYYWVKEVKKREFQREVLIEFIELARELDLPLVVHSREAETDAIVVLKETKATRIQLHCFNQPEQVDEASVQDWYMSVPTSVCTRRRMQRVASAMPLAQMLLETDAPYLSPLQGHQNEPANLIHAVAKIAQIKAATPDIVAHTTTNNALSLFRLERSDVGLRRY